MKRLLEFKVYDILQDKENVKFMDKVKKENPELYVKFLNIISNKGLDVAKERYEDYDPNRVKIRKEREKEEQLRRKRENTKKEHEKRDQEILEKYKEEIQEIQKVIFSSKLDDIIDKIDSDENISNYLKSCRTKKRYENNFKKLLREPKKLDYELRYNILLETEYYTTDSVSYWESGFINIIYIQHYYNLKSKESTYYPMFNLYVDDFDNIILIDKNKEDEYLEDRNKYAKTLANKMSFDDILLTIRKISLLLSDETYERWKLQKDADKYNL
jgi:hypothetical protein